MKNYFDTVGGNHIFRLPSAGEITSGRSDKVSNQGASGNRSFGFN
jgi:hypothetical protein